MNRVTILCLPVIIFPQRVLSLPNGFMNKVAVLAVGGYAQIQQHGLPLTKPDLATATAEYPICQPQKPTLSL